MCENFTRYQQALNHNNVPAEFHAYNSGFHGWAFGSQYYCNYLNEDNQHTYMLSDPADTKYGEGLGPVREDFERSLLRWMSSLRQ